ncbi:tRNA guanine26-N2-dimethyltransferase [Hondaea fermentalgiana]|uniref:tRNA (guanine(26)-N(2))-dimethyltransferase n=1 Tax=Hondaea fermentalgiana TaxID=2315210 RepID=A0A2R5GVM0_9STRA|nr:tRNA guanine26-N2-dimethyltransferase [Hondaea fermentalgiana]|eukprot:GBG31964.1 tRNA guanine26-N2-dimethyltransferase [Hondaea fermentalgiana]
MADAAPGQEAKATSPAENNAAPAPAADNADASAIKAGKVPEGYTTVTEGAASILFKRDEVFYNEVQIKNRDLSVLVLNEYATQLEHEANEQYSRRSKNLSWRKLPPTEQTWGPDFARDAPALVNNKAAQRATKAKANADSQAEADTAATNAKATETKDAAGAVKDAAKTEDRGSLTGLRILEALSASGLRSIRYAKEISDGVGVDKIIANDLETHAVNAIRLNLSLNGLKDGEVVTANEADANMYMYHHRTDAKSSTEHTRIEKFIPKASRPFDAAKDPFDVIDLDPYGPPTPFLDASVQSVREGGLLCITATDLPTLCGKSFETCFSRYKAQPLRSGNYPHEMALRILLACIEMTANTHGKNIVPLLSVHMDFYIRVFVRVYSNKNEVKQAPTKLGLVLQSRGCDSFYIQPFASSYTSKSGNSETVRPAAFKAPNMCPETGADMAIGGPIWIKPMHNAEFVKSLLSRFSNQYTPKSAFDARELGGASLVHPVVANVADELIDTPLHYSLPHLCSKLHCEVPTTEVFHSALANAGYKVSKTHSSPQHVKTNAPPEFIWDVLRVWVKERSPVNSKHLQDPESIASKILAKEPTHKVDLSINSEIRKRGHRDRAISRYKGNPKPNWGPKPAAAGSKSQQTHRRRNRGANDQPAGDNSFPTSKRSRPNPEPDWKSF